jgi:hypothetical protein
MREGDQWMREVVMPEFGEALTEDWGDWLHQVFTTQGALRGPDLRRLASAAQHQAAEAASRRVAADVAQTTGLTVSIGLVERDGTMRIACDGEFSSDDSGGFFAIGDEEAAAEVADTVQDILLERLWRVWPTCPQHDSGLHPDFIDGGAVWLCRSGRHYTPVGELPGSPDRP